MRSFSKIVFSFVFAICGLVGINKLQAQLLEANTIFEKSSSSDHFQIKGLTDVDINVWSKSLEAYKSIDQINHSLQLQGLSESKKVRSIFTWMSRHIIYDAQAAASLDIPSQQPEAVISRRTAVCEGYARLFNSLCEINQIESRMVVGFVKSRPGDVINAETPNHAWNAVKVNGRWFLVDVGWASQALAQAPETEKSYALNMFYLVSPARLIQTHFPEDPMWQLLPEPVCFEDFSRGKVELIAQNQTTNVNELSQLVDQFESLDSLDREIARLERQVQHNRNAEYDLGLAYYKKATQMISTYNYHATYNKSSLIKRMIFYMDKSVEQLSKLSPGEKGFDIASTIIHSIITHKGTLNINL
ncbi:MAG: hypothetical protein JJU28_06845 [Cyclobacteriaceae bacterium]|nr:hypothetical protein [Cyclobacteriaceae bacterium]